MNRPGHGEDRESEYRRLFPDLPTPVYEPLQFERRPLTEMRERAAAWCSELEHRRSTRDFSTEPVPRDLIELAIRSAGTAPSGAHTQPWSFVAIDDPELKRTIRAAAEDEEYKTYTRRMSDEWRLALAPLGTDWVKRHITNAPWVVVLFKRTYEITAADGTQLKNFYVSESVGICAGLFISAIHHMGLVTLTHTPNPMRFLGELLGRPRNETAVLLLPVGYPASRARVPKLTRKPIDEILQWNLE